MEGGTAKDTLTSSLVMLTWTEVAVAPLDGMAMISLGGVVLSLMCRLALAIAKHLTQAGVRTQTCLQHHTVAIFLPGVECSVLGTTGCWDT